MSTRAQKIARLANKDYRDAFVASQISVGLPFQIRALREQRGWKQSELATKASMLQSRISAMESPGGAKFNLETLRRLASAFDVALIVKFIPFSELVFWSEKFAPDSFEVPRFDQDPGLIERKQPATAADLFRTDQSSMMASQDEANLDNLIIMMSPKHQGATAQSSHQVAEYAGAAR